MALTTEDKQEMENYLASKGVHCDTEVSFPKSDDKFLVVGADGTGKYIETEHFAEYLKTHEADPERAAIIDLINRDEFKNVYNNGDAIIETWTIDNKVYSWPLVVVNNSKDVVLADGTTAAHRAIMQPLYCPHFGVQWSQYRAFLACPEGLAAGTYSITFAQAWSKLTSDMLTWSFTLTKAVPSGGRIAGFRNFADGQSDKNIRVYQNDGKTLVETVTASQGAADGATDLGTLGYTTRSGNLSSMQETFYGSNDPDVSAVMQWLNSDADVGMWWVPKDQWDVAPDALASYKGYLAYLDPEHVKVMKTVQVKTLYNTVQGHAAADYRTDYCRAYPPSLEEMYIQPFSTAGVEGEYLPYYKELLGTDSPVAKYATYPELITYDVVNKGAQHIWLRSGFRSNAYNQFICYSSGGVSNGFGRDTGRVRPLEVW